MKEQKTFCVSHVKDVDGIGAAALVRAATGAQFLLTDYGTMVEDLAKVPKDTAHLVICDLGTDESSVDRFIAALSSLAKGRRITYIDHHFASPETKKRIKELGVRLVHRTTECASVLTYSTFKGNLPPKAKYIALYGAVTDYMDHEPVASRLMQKTDRHYVLVEATLLSESVAFRGDEAGYPEMLVRELASMKAPHQIGDVVRTAVAQLDRMDSLAETVREHGRRMKRLAYMDTTEHATGNVAKLLIGEFDVPVGVSYRERQKGWFEVSVRCTSECRVHLGKTIGKIALSLGGSGGGHRLAAGCRIPASRVDEMLAALDRRV